MKYLTMLQIVFLVLMSCSSLSWKEYKDNINHFIVKYPEKWQTKTSVNAVAFLSPREGEHDLFQENVNLMLQDLSQQPLTLERYTEITKKQIVDNLGSSAIVSLKSTTLSGQPAQEFIYNMNYQGRVLKIKQVWFIKGTIAYLFTYTAEPNKYDKYLDISTEIINSFKFI